MKNEELIQLEGTIYNFEDIPINRDIFIVSSYQIAEFKKLWKYYFSEENTEYIHPNNSISYKVGYVQKNNLQSLEINIGVNTSIRFHGVSRIIPKEKIFGCIEFTSIGDNPYLIVDGQWFNEIHDSIYSTFALIDAVGMRKFLETKGEIEEKKILEFNQRVNEVSKENEDFFFFIYADNVLIKTNWNANELNYEKSYNPEYLLAIVKKICEIFKSVYGLDAYAIITQGVNQIKLNAHFEISKETNFLFFNSLGAHFAELFKIEEFVRENIRNKNHIAKNIYLSKSIFLTLRLKNKDEIKNNTVKYESNAQVAFEHEYIHLNWEELDI